jgi:hypothetical protein
VCVCVCVFACVLMMMMRVYVVFVCVFVCALSRPAQSGVFIFVCFPPLCVCSCCDRSCMSFAGGSCTTARAIVNEVCCALLGCMSVCRRQGRREVCVVCVCGGGGASEHSPLALAPWVILDCGWVAIGLNPIDFRDSASCVLWGSMQTSSCACPAANGTAGATNNTMVRADRTVHG